MSVDKKRPAGQKGTIFFRNPPRIRALDPLRQRQCVRVRASAFPGKGAQSWLRFCGFSPQGLRSRTPIGRPAALPYSRLLTPRFPVCHLTSAVCASNSIVRPKHVSATSLNKKSVHGRNAGRVDSGDHMRSNSHLVTKRHPVAWTARMPRCTMYARHWFVRLEVGREFPYSEKICLARVKAFSKSVGW